MENSIRFNVKKRTLLLCVFFVLASCSQAPQEEHDQTVDAVEIEAPTQTPLLSLSELLSAKDVKAQLASAAEQNDTLAIKEIQEILLKAADEVYLADSERKLIEGETGLVFLQFQGMKTNYQQDFDEAFFNFGNLEAVYQQYPAFESLHANSRALVEKRDLLIQNAAASLKESGFEGDATAEAKKQWQALMKEQIE